MRVHDKGSIPLDYQRRLHEMDALQEQLEILSRKAKDLKESGVSDAVNFRLHFTSPLRDWKKKYDREICPSIKYAKEGLLAKESLDFHRITAQYKASYHAHLTVPLRSYLPSYYSDIPSLGDQYVGEVQAAMRDARQKIVPLLPKLDRVYQTFIALLDQRYPDLVSVERSIEGRSLKQKKKILDNNLMYAIERLSDKGESALPTINQIARCLEKAGELYGEYADQIRDYEQCAGQLRAVSRRNLGLKATCTAKDELNYTQEKRALIILSEMKTIKDRTS